MNPRPIRIVPILILVRLIVRRDVRRRNIFGIRGDSDRGRRLRGRLGYTDFFTHGGPISGRRRVGGKVLQRFRMGSRQRRIREVRRSAAEGRGISGNQIANITHRRRNKVRKRRSVNIEGRSRPMPIFREMPIFRDVLKGRVPSRPQGPKACQGFVTTSSCGLRAPREEEPVTAMCATELQHEQKPTLAS